MQIEIVSVHYKTPDLIYKQYESVRRFYPEIPYRIIDGSDDGNMYFSDLEKKDPHFKVVRFGYNIHHGPGMHAAITSSSYPFLLILDSDVTIKSALIEKMMSVYQGYAVGKLLTVNKNGKELWQKKWWHLKTNYPIKYVHPYCMLINKNAYLEFKPFVKHGAPCIEAMKDIFEKGKTERLVSFHIEEYVDLVIQGTRSRWGINLK